VTRQISRGRNIQLATNRDDATENKEPSNKHLRLRSPSKEIKTAPSFCGYMLRSKKAKQKRQQEKI